MKKIRVFRVDSRLIYLNLRSSAKICGELPLLHPLQLPVSLALGNAPLLRQRF
jgi:hypothetical protein